MSHKEVELLTEYLHVLHHSALCFGLRRYWGTFLPLFQFCQWAVSLLFRKAVHPPAYQWPCANVSVSMQPVIEHAYVLWICGLLCVTSYLVWIGLDFITMSILNWAYIGKGHTYLQPYLTSWIFWITKSCDHKTTTSHIPIYLFLLVFGLGSILVSMSG